MTPSASATAPRASLLALVRNLLQLPFSMHALLQMISKDSEEIELSCSYLRSTGRNGGRQRSAGKEEPRHLCHW